MKQAAYKSYSKKGEKIVNMNYAAIDAGGEGVVKVEIPEAWKTTTEGAPMVAKSGDKYFDEVFIRSLTCMATSFRFPPLPPMAALCPPAPPS